MKAKLLCAVTMVLAFPQFLPAQAASVFVKAAPGYCWEDTKAFVKQNGRGFTMDESQYLLVGQVAELRSGGGDISVSIRTLADKNKKGEEGCSVIVELVGGAAASTLNQKVNARAESGNIQVANRIAAFINAREKDRAKKEKKP